MTNPRQQRLPLQAPLHRNRSISGEPSWLPGWLPCQVDMALVAENSV